MTKVQNETLAKMVAKEKGQWWGKSLIDGFYYIGTSEQLKNIGVLVFQRKGKL